VGAGPGADLDPLSQTLLKVVVGLAVLLIVLVGVALEYDSGEADLNPIAAAAEQTQSNSGARMTMTATYSTPGEAMTFKAEGDGEVNWRTGRERMKLTVPIPGHSVTVEAVNDPRKIYMRTSLPDQHLPPGKEWVAIEPFLGHDPSTALAGNADAGQQLKSLESTGGVVENLGEETIRGVSTTRYRGSIEVGRLARRLRAEGESDVAKLVEQSYAGASPTIPVEVWIDDHGFIRRLRQRMPIPGNDSAADLTMDMQVDFYDLGIEPDISLPPSSTVFDATPLVRAELEAVGGGANHPAPTADAGVSKADFLARARGVCRDAIQEVRDLSVKAKRLQRVWTRTVRREGLKGETTLRAAQRLAGGFYEPLMRSLNRAIGDLSEISPPPSLAGLYRRYLKISWAQVETLRGETRAFEIGNYKMTDTLAKRIEKLGQKSEKIGKRIGISECDKS